jgi:hypothetical protein
MGLRLHARKPANVGLQPATTCGNPRRDLAKTPLGLLGIASALAVGRVRAHPLPDRERELARQTKSSSLDEWIELGQPALPLELGWMHPACHRLFFTPRREISEIYRRRPPSGMRGDAANRGAAVLRLRIISIAYTCQLLHRFMIPAHRMLSSCYMRSTSGA